MKQATTTGGGARSARPFARSAKLTGSQRVFSARKYQFLNVGRQRFVRTEFLVGGGERGRGPRG